MAKKDIVKANPEMNKGDFVSDGKLYVSKSCSKKVKEFLLSVFGVGEFNHRDAVFVEITKTTTGEWEEHYHTPPAKWSRNDRNYQITVRVKDTKGVFPKDYTFTLRCEELSNAEQQITGQKFVKETNSVTLRDYEEAVIFFAAHEIYKVLRQNGPYNEAHQHTPLVKGRATSGYANRFALTVLEKWRKEGC